MGSATSASARRATRAPSKDTVFALGAGTTFVQRLASGGLQFPSGGDQQLYAPNNNDLAVRAGFSYSVGRNTILRGSYGIFYDRPFDNLWQNLRNNNLLVPLFALSGTPTDYMQPIASLLPQQ